MFFYIFLFRIIFPLPQWEIRTFHGFVSDCVSGTNLNAWFPQNFQKCVETGTFQKTFASIWDQALEGCNLLIKETQINPWIFDNGLYLVGISLGTLIARTLYKICKPISPFVKRIVNYGGPNLGLAVIPFTNIINEMNDEQIKKMIGIPGINVSQDLLKELV